MTSIVRAFTCLFILAFTSARLPAEENVAEFDILIKGGRVYDGTGGAPAQLDVGIAGDHIAAVGKLSGARAKKTIDARSLAVAPGFINMLSWSNESLIEDGRSQSEIRQGITTEIMG